MLTLKQRQALTFIHQHQVRTGTSPTYMEIAVALNLRSKSNVARILEALEEREFIAKRPNRARAIEILRMHGQAPANVTADLVSALQWIAVHTTDQHAARTALAALDLADVA